MSARLYVFGGSFNPPGNHHVAIVHELSMMIQKSYEHGSTLVIPCGPRLDKPSTQNIDPGHRAAMAQMAFPWNMKAYVDFSDLEKGIFTRTFDLHERLRKCNPDSQIWYVVGADMVRGAESGQSEIQREWFRGAELFRSLNFLIVPRGDELSDKDLPPNNEVMDLHTNGSSTMIRKMCARGQSIDHLVDPRIASYIQRWGLYGNRRVDGSTTTFQAKGQALIYDVASSPNNQDHRHQARVRKLIQIVQNAQNHQMGSDHIIAIGGDGWMLDMIRLHHGLRIPIIGLNAGTVGYLLNDGSMEELQTWLRRGTYTMFREPLLRVAYVAQGSNEPQITHAFNEGFLRSANDQAGWMHVSVDGQGVLKRLVGDGLMLATPGGSTGWSRSKGGLHSWIGAPHLVLTGDATTHEGRRWNSSLLEKSSLVEIQVIDPQKRPMRLVVDGKDCGLVHHLAMSKSRTHAVELGFFPEVAARKRFNRIRNG
jgi:NAD+ kinase